MIMQKIKWGILSTARIGVNKVIPALQNSRYSEVVAIASRDIQKAETAAKKHHIPKFYGSYELLLEDPEIDAVYNPLPNHLHVPWSINALKASKHVLCEKPIGLSVQEAEYLLNTSYKYPKLKIMEAFMYRFHPQWHQAKNWVKTGKIGTLRTIHSFFSYFNDDPNNIRNMNEIGGGGLMDIGCYCISLSRLIYDDEPKQVMGTIELDPQFGTDRLTSGILQFKTGTATFTCSTQLIYHQRVHILGTEGRIEIEIPFNAPNDQPSQIWLQTHKTRQKKTFKLCDQYTLQGDHFSLAILNDTEVPISLTDSVANMHVIEAIIKSSHEKRMVDV